LRSSGKTLPELIGLLKHFTGDLTLKVLCNFATDHTMTRDDFVYRPHSISIADNLTKSDLLALNCQ